MIKRILVAIDGSESANAGLSIAGSLAGIIGAELIGLFVEDTARLKGDTAEIAAEETLLEAESMELYQAFQDRCDTSKVDGRFLSIRGVPNEVIRERAKAVDFVVLGNYGLHEGVNKEQGDTVLGLLRSVARPILVVPEDASGEPKIVIAYDGSLPADRALRAAAELAEISQMTDLHLLTASASNEECKSIQAPALDYLSAYDLHVTPVCVTGNPEEAIISYVSQVDASVLVIAAFGPNRTKDGVFGKTTEAVMKSVDAAVLLVA